MTAYFTDQMGEEFRRAIADAIKDEESVGEEQRKEVRKGRKKKKRTIPKKIARKT